MKKLRLKSGFQLLPHEITLLTEMPKNASDTVLNTVQKRFVGQIYYKYFGSLPISATLLENEMKTPWADGSRKKEHQAQRAVLDWLHMINASMPAPGWEAAGPNAADLEWLLSSLLTATPNYLIILPLATEVYTETEPTKANAAGPITDGANAAGPAGEQ